MDDLSDLTRPLPPSKTVETEVLASRCHRLLSTFLQKASGPASDHAEAVATSEAMQHAMDDLAVIFLATHAADAAGRVASDASARSGPLHPAWQQFFGGTS